MEHNKDLDEQIFDYVNGSLDVNARDTFEKAMANSPSLAKRVEEQLVLHRALKATRADEPGLNFTNIVMARIDAPPLAKTILKGLFLLSGIVVMITVAAWLLKAGAFDGAQPLDLNQLGVGTDYLKRSLPAVPVNGKLIVNIIIVLNVVLALLVLDRTILKPWFQRRSNAV